MRLLVLIPIALLAACTPTPRQAAAIADAKAADEIKLARLLQGYTPGPPQACLPQQTGYYHTEGVGETILYRGKEEVIYRNDTNGCHRVARGDIQVSQIFGPRLCRGQVIDTFDPASRVTTGGCSLNDFIPYRRNK